MWRRAPWAVTLFAAAGLHAWGQEIPRGQIVDSVKCEKDASQSYALYLPSNYDPAKEWKTIFAFDAGGRGRTGVERFQAAAEKYGYIVAGSNNSRNGPWSISLTAAQAMTDDVLNRFSVDMKRIYTTGQSGGARVALRLALDTRKIAGVIASSAGFPDGDAQDNAPFPIFGTAGTEDFNYIEMWRLNQQLDSPHRIVNFVGGHTWLPSELAMQAVEWMELQAMKSGLAPRNDDLLNKVWAERIAEIEAQSSGLAAYRAVRALEADFQGLRDVSEFTARGDELKKQQSVLDEFARERQSLDDEEQTALQLSILQLRLGQDAQTRASTLIDLKQRLGKLAAVVNGPEDTGERRKARRLVATFRTSGRGIDDPEYQQLIRTLFPEGR